MKNIVRYFLIFLIITIAVIYCSIFFYEQDEKGIYNTQLELVVKENGTGWSYEIYDNNNILIKQEIIPGVSGKQYFATKNEAKKIGKLVLMKLRNHQQPTITVKELEDSKINFVKEIDK